MALRPRSAAAESLCAPAATSVANFRIARDRYTIAGQKPTWTKPLMRRTLRDVPGKVNCPPERVLHIDHPFARMQRLNTYEAKTNAMTRIGSNLSQVLPPPFSCE